MTHRAGLADRAGSLFPLLRGNQTAKDLLMKKCILALAGLFILATVAQAADLPDFTALAERCGPAVVNINTERKASASEDMFGGMFRNMPPGLDRFFEEFGGMPQRPGNRPPMRRQRSLGSGFLVSADGYIVTNYHVVADADTIRVTMDTNNGRSKDFPATLIGSDEDTDLALLKVEGENLPYLVFGNSDNLKVGEWLLAIGNPFGLDHTVTAGILSAKGRNINSGPFDNFLQTDASINPGNSGGPLLNMAGQVVGINTAIIASGQGIGFAIPSTMAARIIDQIKDGKKVSRGWIGVTIQDIDDNTARALGMEDSAGALIGSVLPGEPAAKAGLRDGDVITAVDGQPVSDSADLLRAIAEKAPGTQAVITVWRDGKMSDITVTLGERKTSQGGSSVRNNPSGTSTPLPGVSVRELTKAEREENKISGDSGLLIVSVDPDSSAAEVLEQGDIILRVNQVAVNTPDQLARIVGDVGKRRGAVLLQLQRGGQVFYRSLPLDK